MRRRKSGPRLTGPLPAKKPGGLVLARKLHEKILITTESGETILISVSEITQKEIRLRFIAKREISILRTDAVQKTRARAA